MVRKLIFGAAVLVLTAACSSDEVSQWVNPAPGTLTVKAQVNDELQSRVSFTEQGEAQKGLKVSWQTQDVIKVFTADGTATGSLQVSALSDDGHTASFTGSLEPTPTAETPIHACVSNTAATTTGSQVTFNWSSQTGKVESLGNYDILTASAQYNPTAATSVAMTFHHAMAFLKAAIKLPAAAGTSTAKVTLSGDGLCNAVNWQGTSNTFGTPEEGSITLTDAKVDGNLVTCYVALYPGTISNVMATVEVSDRAYANLTVTDEATLTAGKLYTVGRNATTLEDLSVWISDAAWSHTYDVADYKITQITKEPAEGSDWLTVTSDGSKVVVSATANTTGAPRQCTLFFGNGYSTMVDVTQMEMKDLVGDWNLTTFKRFDATGSAALQRHDNKFGYVASTASSSVYDMTVHEGVDYGNNAEIYVEQATGTTATAYEGLTQKKQTATNNLRLNGIYENMRTEALAKIDYTEMAATMSIFFDVRSTTTLQRLYTGPFAGQYVALMPELYQSSTDVISSWNSGSFKLHFATIGGDQMFWYTGKIAVVGHTTTVRWEAHSGALQTLSTSTAYKVVGLQVDRYFANVSNATNLIRQADNTTANAAYARVYQGDIVMRRTANGYQEIIGGGNN